MSHVEEESAADKNTAELGKLNAMNAYAPPSLGDSKDFLHTILRVSYKKRTATPADCRCLFLPEKKSLGVISPDDDWRFKERASTGVALPLPKVMRSLC